ncbi:hypothetical protein CVT26_016103 [Gymnopilus dilepis]|uniref:Uncharacterized protein n=1 Tax=Gymnopilus dilepis TaxID=231916 RepID=A0A409WAB4_9AGAR|nr:hypothetical protein CVT26_016103 [Gymnopilus dilepis]
MSVFLLMFSSRQTINAADRIPGSSPDSADPALLFLGIGIGAAKVEQNEKIRLRLIINEGREGKLSQRSGPDPADPANPWNRRQEQKIDFSVFRGQSACTSSKLDTYFFYVFVSQPTSTSSKITGKGVVQTQTPRRPIQKIQNGISLCYVILETSNFQRFEALHRTVCPYVSGEKPEA